MVLLSRFSYIITWKEKLIISFSAKLLTSNFNIIQVLQGGKAKARVEMLTKKSRNPLRKWISLKFPVLPCFTLKRVNKQFKGKEKETIETLYNGTD